MPLVTGGQSPTSPDSMHALGMVTVAVEDRFPMVRRHAVEAKVAATFWIVTRAM